MWSVVTDALRSRGIWVQGLHVAGSAKWIKILHSIELFCCLHILSTSSFSLRDGCHSHINFSFLAHHNILHLSAVLTVVGPADMDILTFIHTLHDCSIIRHSLESYRSNFPPLFMPSSPIPFLPFHPLFLFSSHPFLYLLLFHNLLLFFFLKARQKR